MSLWIPFIARRVHSFDQSLLQFIVSHTGHGRARRFASQLSWLGNWFLYLIILLGMLAYMGRAILSMFLCASISELILHSIYPLLKRKVARGRPEQYQHLQTAPAYVPLDQYSFPSGHVMTLTGVLISIVYGVPKLYPAALLLWGAMAWSRLALNQHYPTDILFAALLAAVVTLPFAFIFIG